MRQQWMTAMIGDTALGTDGDNGAKAQQGEVAMVADLAGPGYKFELSSAVPSFGLPKATLKFPIGEVSLEEKEKEEEEVKKMLSINGMVKGQLLNGMCTAQYQDESLNLRYLYKVDWLKRRSIFRDFCLKMEIMILLASVGWNS